MKKATENNKAAAVAAEALARLRLFGRWSGKNLKRFGRWSGKNLKIFGRWSWKNLKRFGRWSRKNLKIFRHWSGKNLKRFGRWSWKTLKRFGRWSWKNLKRFGRWSWKTLKRFGRWSWKTLKRFGRWSWKTLKRFGRWSWKTLKRFGRWCRENFRVERAEIGRIALNGLIFQNPTFVLLLGMCPTLAVTTSLQNGLGMGLATTAVLACSELAISLLRKFIPNEVRIASYVVVIATFVTAVDLLLQAFVPVLSAALGLYIPLIVVNCIILGRAEAFASRHKPGGSLLDGLFTGLGFTGALCILGAIREILGAGSIWGVPLPVIKDYPVGLILAPCGGFLTLGFLVALVQWLRTRPRKGGKRA